jgi:hypothetical protein
MMSVKKLILFGCLGCLLAVDAVAQQYAVRKDFASEWTYFEEGKYEAFTGTEKVSTIYFRLDASKFQHDLLAVSSPQPFNLFIDGKLAGTGTRLHLDIDSLAGIFSPSFTVAIRQKRIWQEDLSTRVLTRAPQQASTEEQLVPRNTSFRDFAVIGLLVLVMLVITIIRLNPKLASDYFSVIKIFSMREVDDSQVYTRITSSTNILFYIFCSLMLGYYLMIIFHFLPTEYTTALLFKGEDFPMAMLQWLELSLIVLGIFFVKMTLVYGLTSLFGVPEAAGTHFFNWVRVLLVVFGTVTIIMSGYFIMHGQHAGFFYGLLQFFGWTLVLWMVLIIFKLSSKMSHSLFHLFSYICATELIPFLITLKVLYN